MKTAELTNALIIIRDRTTDQWEREVLAEACNRITVGNEVSEALKAACDAIGDWSRPTAMNGMTVPSHDDPLILTMKRGYAALANARRETL